MITLNFYNCSAENNRVDKTGYMNFTNQYMCLWKEETSYMTPIIELNLPEQNGFKKNISNIGNYCQLREGDGTIGNPTVIRWYYVVDVVSVRNNYWRLYLKLDVLMTYREFIINSLPCIVDRNEFAFNPYLNDPLFPLTEQVSLVNRKSYKLYGSESERESENAFCYVVKVINKSSYVKNAPFHNEQQYNFYSPHMANPYGVGSESVYILPLMGLNVKLNDNDRITVWSFGELKALLSTNSQYESYTISCTAYPLDLIANFRMAVSFTDTVGEIIITDSYNQISIEKIKIGTETLNFYAIKVLPNYEPFLNVTIPMSDLRLSNSFIDYSPYSTYQMYLPYYGSYSIDIKSVKALELKNIRITYVIELYSGSCNITLYGNSKFDGKMIILDTVSCSIGSPIDINSSTADKVNRQKLVNEINYTASMTVADNNLAYGISNTLTNGIASARKSFLNGNPVGVLATPFEMVDSGYSVATQYMNSKEMANANKYSADIVNIPYGIKGTRSVTISNSFYMSQRNVELIVYRNEIITAGRDIRFHSYGRSLNSARDNLTNLYGYTVLSDFHLDGLIAYENEKSELASLLMGGIILPDPPST